MNSKLAEELKLQLADTNDFAKSLLAMDEEAFWDWILRESDTHPFTGDEARSLIRCLLINLRSVVPASEFKKRVSIN